jgi:hypothetical protein
MRPCWIDRPVKRAQLGSSGVYVTELGFGTAPIGNLYTAVDDATARAAVLAAWDGGVRYFDLVPISARLVSPCPARAAAGPTRGRHPRRIDVGVG